MNDVSRQPRYRPDREADRADFGINEWFVDEMREQYRRDPASVDPAWRAMFMDRPRERAGDEPPTTVLRGAAARVAANMDASLRVPTATSARAIPAKVLVDNRSLINEYLAVAGRARVSVTHLVGYALVQAVKRYPQMNAAYAAAGQPDLEDEILKLGLVERGHKCASRLAFRGAGGRDGIAVGLERGRDPDDEIGVVHRPRLLRLG